MANVIKPLSLDIKGAKVQDLEAHIAKSKVIESVLTDIKNRPGIDTAGFDFGLSFSLNWDHPSLPEQGFEIAKG